MTFNQKTAKLKVFAFVTERDQVFIELQKLNGIKFHGNKLLIKESISGKKLNLERTEISNTMTPKIL